MTQQPRIPRYIPFLKQLALKHFSVLQPVTKMGVEKAQVLLL